MMGAASQFALNAGRTRAAPKEGTPEFVAAPHALRMKPGVRRAWYGKMHLLPAQLELAEPVSTDIRELRSVHRKLAAIPTDCNNVTDFFCWSHCLTIPEEPEEGNGEDYGLYCVQPSLVVEEPDGTSDFEAAYEKCGGGFAHNSKCKGMWFLEEEAAEGVPEYDLSVRDQIAIRVYINFDAYPEDISWTLSNTCDGTNVIAEGGDYDRNLFNKTAYVNVPTTDGTFEFTIEDAYGDGLCCNYLEGSYYVSNYSPWYGKNEKFVSSKMENPSSIETTRFETGSCPSSDTPTKSPTPNFSEDKARYNPINMAPQCGGSLNPITAPLVMCTTVGTGLLNAKKISGEPNGPNSIHNACQDGDLGDYTYDESIESVTLMASGDSEVLEKGGTAKLVAEVYTAYFAGDKVDFFIYDGMYWQLINSVTPPKGTPYTHTVESDEFTLPKVTLANTRTIIRRLGDPYYNDTSVPSNCPTTRPGEGLYSDVDDLIVELADDTPPAPTPPPSPSSTSSRVPTSSEGAACYDISIHKCKCEPDLCNEEKCTDAGMIWTETCVPTDSTPEPCTCDDFFGEDVAQYHPVNMAPQCGGSLFPITKPLERCTTVGTGLLNAKKVSGEPNGPNSIHNACQDGELGDYTYDESITLMASGASQVLEKGGTAKLQAEVYTAYFAGDKVDFFIYDGMYWQLINSVTPPKGAAFTHTVVSDDFTLPKVTLANTRTIIRRLGDPYYDDTSVPSKCPTSRPGEGLYSDVDDLIVELADKPPEYLAQYHPINMAP